MSFFFCSGEGGRIVFFFLSGIFLVGAMTEHLFSQSCSEPSRGFGKIKKESNNREEEKAFKEALCIFGYMWIFMIFTKNWYKRWTELKGVEARNVAGSATNKAGLYDIVSSFKVSLSIQR